jgi:hypothetical protein
MCGITSFLLESYFQLSNNEFDVRCEVCKGSGIFDRPNGTFPANLTSGFTVLEESAIRAVSHSDRHQML